jgi:hypothetical protein
MLMKRFRRFTVLGCAVIAFGVLAGAVAVVASAGISRHGRGASARNSAHAMAMRRARRRALMLRRGLIVLSGRPRRLPGVLGANFRVFRAASSARTRPAARGPGQFPGVPKDIVSTWGLAVGDATQIANSVGLYIWLVPGSSGTCLEWTNPAVPLGGGGGGDCVSNSMAAAGELSPLASLTSGEMVVIGLAPDANAAVKLTTADGASQSAPVSDNVYAAKAPHAFNAVTLTDSSGTVVKRRVPDGS